MPRPRMLFIGLPACESHVLKPAVKTFRPNAMRWHLVTYLRTAAHHGVLEVEAGGTLPTQQNIEYVIFAVYVT